MNHVREAADFEEYARSYLSDYWHISLEKRQVRLTDEFEKEFDLVSQDNSYVGDAKYLSNNAVPAAKWSAIAEYVWLLEKVNSTHKFLVFGKDKELSQRWLNKHRTLLREVKFYFLSDNNLEELH